MNQTIEPDSEQNDMPLPSVAAGQRLREAREALGLNREDVARELRLQEKLITALEEGDRSQLPPSAFISGYLRSYARLLGLPAEQLIADYLAERVPPSLYRATDRTGVQIVSSRDPKFKIATFVVVAVTLLLFAAWWANQRFSFISTPTQTAETSGDQHEIAAKLPEPMPLYQEPHPEEATAEPAQPSDGKTLPPTAAAPGGALPPATSQPAAVATQPHAAQAAAPVPGVAQPRAPQPAATLPGPTATPAQKSQAVTSTAAPSASVQAEPAKPVSPVAKSEPLSPSVPQSLLVIEYQAASWTEVEDANGRVLAHGTINPGRKLQLHGVAPFKVFLGYSPGVTVYYNGTLFSHAAYQRGDLAHFTVGSSQDNRPLVR